MGLSLSRKSKSELDPEVLLAKLNQAEGRQDFFLLSVRGLLQFIKDFALDLREIESDAFKKDIDALGETFGAEPKLKRIHSIFEKSKKRIRTFISRQKKYIQERETELKDIIDLLAKAMVTIDSENREYNQKIYEQSEKIERITHLDDIKKLKQMLIGEIERLRLTIQEKQSRENEQIQILSKKVDTLNQELEKAKVESMTDSLTGVHNRKAFDQYLLELVERNTVSRTPFSLLMLDIDDFKSINDSFGHQTGDRVLWAVAKKCRGFVRSGDFIARYGGEEFAIILPDASLRNALKKAKSICKDIASTRYYLEEGAQEDQTLKVTVSIGVSCYSNGDTVADITGRSDQALYLAKRSGKNQALSEKEAN